MMLKHAERPWLKHYNPGVPDSLGDYPRTTIQYFLQQTAQKYPNKPCLLTSVRLPVVGHQRHVVTYGELDKLSDALACALIGLGLQKGQHVAIIMPNISAFVISYFAVLKAGGVVVACNPSYPAAKLRYQLDNSDSVMALTITALYNTLKEIQAQTRVKKVVVTNIKEYLAPLARTAFSTTQEKKGGHYLEKLEEGDHWFQDLLKQYRGQKPSVDVYPSDLAILQYTGGTTGVSKGVMVTHEMMSFSTQQVDRWTDLDYSADIYGKSIKREDFTALVVLPLFHIFGLVVLISQSIRCAWQILLVADPRDMNNVVDLVDVYKPEVFLGVPLFFHGFANHPRVKSGEVTLKHCRILLSSAAPLHPDVHADVTAAGGINLAEAYGLSELPAGNHSNPIIGKNRLTSVGVPMPDVEYRIVDVETGQRELPIGEVGEVILRAPNMMPGYYKMPEETAQVLREFEGRTWLYTGDLGYADEDGFLYLRGRKKDMALIGGFNVYPVMVEAALRQHPAIADVGVWSVPHPKVPGEEALQAWVVLKPGEQVKSGDLVNFCRPLLAAYEIPRRFVFVDALPYSEAGKLLRRELPNLQAEPSE
ncbi:MAG: AMP-binding protein [Anaerolineae bacterium]|nr:AMP-binding protein [Anaerolineae bacterium]MDW8173624.1 AMP-binding protein [Anaerolineae bacterium]